MSKGHRTVVIQTGSPWFQKQAREPLLRPPLFNLVYVKEKEEKHEFTFFLIKVAKSKLQKTTYLAENMQQVKDFRNQKLKALNIHRNTHTQRGG